MKLVARVLLGLSACLLVLGALLALRGPDVFKKTPLDVDTTLVYEGTAAKLDTTTGKFVKHPAYAIKQASADSEHSNDSHVLFVESNCLVFDDGGPRECVKADDPKLISATIATYATDRVTALAVSDPALPDDSVVDEGLVNKFPFDVKKQTYPFWDAAMGHAVDMEYQDTEKVDGLDTYRFEYSVKDANIDVAAGIPGTYDNVVTAWVDPTTGSIVKSAQNQQRYLDDGTPVVDVDVTATDATVRAKVDEAKDSARALWLVTTVVPVIGLSSGSVVLLVAVALLAFGRSRPTGTGGTRVALDRTPAGV